MFLFLCQLPGKQDSYNSSIISFNVFVSSLNMELVVLDQNHKPIDALDAINLLATFEIYLIKTGVTVVSIVPLAPGPRPTSDQSGRSICIQ